MPVCTHQRYACFELKAYFSTHWNVKYLGSQSMGGSISASGRSKSACGGSISASGVGPGGPNLGGPNPLGHPGFVLLILMVAGKCRVYRSKPLYILTCSKIQFRELHWCSRCALDKIVKIYTFDRCPQGRSGEISFLACGDAKKENWRTTRLFLKHVS